MICLRIKKYEGNYDRGEFYSLMGKFFAEPAYKKQLPYLVNRESNIWFVAINNDVVIGFVAINETKKIIKLEHDFVEEAYRKNKIYEKLNGTRLAYVKDASKALDVIVKEAHLIQYWSKLGFKEYRQNGTYHYLRKEKSDED